jgi:hypothetical protein
LESLETSFHQDLNGDGVIGIPAATSPSAAVTNTAPVTVANNDTSVLGSNPPVSSFGGEGIANAIPTGFHQDLNGDGVIGVPPATSPAPTVPVSHAVTVASNDTFVFSPGFGGGTVADAAHAATTELGGFSLLAKNAEFAALLIDAGQPHAQFQWGNDGHDAAVNHDSMTLINAHMADLHANDFIIR